MGLLLGQAGAPDKSGEELCIQIGYLLLLARPGREFLHMTFGIQIWFGLHHPECHPTSVLGLLQNRISTG